MEEGMSRITMLGTGSAMCTRCYNTCFYLKTPAGGMLTDGGGGNGIFRQLFRAGIDVENIHHIMVTHVHTDHLLGVIWLIRKISPLQYKGKYRGNLTIYCHDEVKAALETMCNIMIPQKILSALGNTIELREVHDGETLQVDDMEVTFFDIGSTKLKQFGYRATVPDGQTVVCLGDEPYAPVAEQWVRGADWLLHEAFCLYRDREQFRPYEKHHSTALDAGMIARELCVKNLVLYHTEDTHLPTRRESYILEAGHEFKGGIHVPDDLETINLIQHNDTT